MTITLGDTIEDFAVALNATATEFNDGDLTRNTTVDTQDVNYYATGSYDVIFTVVDEDGTEIFKNIYPYYRT